MLRVRAKGCEPLQHLSICVYISLCLWCCRTVGRTIEGLYSNDVMFMVCRLLFST